MSNFLIQITLLGSTKPVVSRVLSVPPLITFYELHEAIAASLDYQDGDASDGGVSPRFDVIEPSGTREIVLSLCPNADAFPDEEHVLDADETRVYKIFDGQEGFRYCEKDFEYTYHEPDRIRHTLVVLGRSDVDTYGKVECIGGQGSTALSDWTDDATSDGREQSGPSGWKFDLAEIKSNLTLLQEKWLYPS